MKLEDLQSEVKLRDVPEAVTLGQFWAAANLGRWLLLWLLTMSPWIVGLWFLPGCILFPMFLLLAISQWGLPVMVRAMGMWLFGGRLSAGDFFRTWRSEFFVRTFYYPLLIFGQGSLFLATCVGVLEGFRGPNRVKRVSALSMTYRMPGPMMDLLNLVWLVFITAGLVSTAISFMPEITAALALESLIDFGHDYPLVNLVWYASWTLGIAFISVLRVSSLFSCYINCRTMLEGWDIEIEFRKMNARLEQLKEGVADEL